VDLYETARTSGAVVARDQGLLRLTGPQRVWFLQNTVTNDVESVPSERWVASCFLDLKGKVVAHFRVGVLDEEIWLDVDPPGLAPLADWFTRNRFRTKVEIEVVERACHTVLGPLAGGDGAVTAQPAFGFRLGDIPAADVFADAPALPVAGGDVYEILRVEAGIGRFGVDYGPDTLPQEAGLTPIVSVTKGCYVGQEVMARLHFRGHVNRTLRKLRFDAPVEPGATLERDGSRVGTVTSSVVSPREGPIGIGMVRVEVDEGDALDAQGASALPGPLPDGTKVRR
jgi:folate-binding protein YgfZ